jgi:NAD(P)H dehydrogenase (quinone)
MYALFLAELLSFRRGRAVSRLEGNKKTSTKEIQMNSSSNLLVLGVTGQVGKLVATNLKRSEAYFSVGSRRRANLEELANQFGSSRFIDLDDPRTFDEALKNVSSIFLITGYTVDMLVQSKTLIDAARRNGVKHIVHLGVFSREHDSYQIVFSWHQLIEAYLRDSEKHGGKDYWFSADALAPDQVAETLTAATGHKFTAEVRDVESFAKEVGGPGSAYESAYAKGGPQFFREVEHGRMAYIGSVTDDTKKLLGREPLLLREWAKLHANELLEIAGS